MSHPVRIDPNMYLKPSEVARMFRVDARTVARWADTGRLPVGGVTPGGRRLFLRTDVMHMLGIDMEEDTQ